MAGACRRHQPTLKPRMCLALGNGVAEFSCHPNSNSAPYIRTTVAVVIVAHPGSIAGLSDAMLPHSNNLGQHSPASRHVGYILHHQSLHLATFLLSQYDAPVPPLRDVNEARQASTNSVRHEAPQRLLLTSAFPDTSHTQLYCL